MITALSSQGNMFPSHATYYKQTKKKKNLPLLCWSVPTSFRVRLDVKSSSKMLQLAVTTFQHDCTSLKQCSNGHSLQIQGVAEQQLLATALPLAERL